MNYGRILIATAVGTVVYYLLGGLVGGLLLADAYRPYTSVYRQSDAILHRMPIGFAGTFIAILMLGLIYARAYRGGAGASQGALFGVSIGVFAACAWGGENFVTLNIGPALALGQAGAAILSWTVVGTVIGLIYKPRRSDR